MKIILPILFILNVLFAATPSFRIHHTGSTDTLLIQRTSNISSVPIVWSTLLKIRNNGQVIGTDTTSSTSSTTGALVVSGGVAARTIYGDTLSAYSWRYHGNSINSFKTVGELNNIRTLNLGKPCNVQLIDTFVLSSITTIDSNMVLDVMGRGYFKKGTGDSLIINGKIGNVPNSHWLDTAVPIRFASGAVESLRPEWWGAKGDGVTDDATAIQRCANSVPQTTIGRFDDFLPDSVDAGNSHILTTSVYFTPGKKYKINTGITFGNYKIWSENAYIFSTDTSIKLFTIPGFYNEIEGLTFNGGKYHIWISGARLNASNTVIKRCYFRNAKTRAIMTDRSGFANSGYPMKLLISDCKSTGSPFLRANTDGTTIENTWISWTSDTSRDGDPGSCIIASGPLSLNNVLGVPDNNSIGQPWIESEGSRAGDILYLRARNFRMGGEDARTPIFKLNSGCSGSTFTFEDCDIQSISSAYWGLLYSYPRLISFNNCSYSANVNTKGLFVSDSLSYSNFLANTKIKFDEMSATLGSKIAYRGSNYLDTSEDYSNILPPENNPTITEVSLPNYLTTATSSLFTTGTGWTSSSYGSISALTNDTSLGYAMAVNFSDSLSGVSKILTNPFIADTQGTYTFSFWVKSNDRTACFFYDKVSDTTKCIKIQEISPGLNRLSCAYYNDAVQGNKIGWTIPLCDSGTLAYGMPAVHKGNIVGSWRPYGYTESHVNAIHYGKTVPSTGTWYLGDIVFNSNPGAYGAIGWQCITAGTPGTWLPIGQQIWDGTTLTAVNRDTSNSHYVASISQKFEQTNTRMQLLSSGTGSSGSAQLFTYVPSSGNNNHWFLHHSGPTQEHKFRIGYGSTASSGFSLFNDTYTKMSIDTLGTVNIPSTTSSTSPTIGALVVSGGIGSPHVTTDSLKIGASGSRVKEMKIIDDSADTLSITVGAKTWKFLPVANQ
jgi:hypothetical protein